MPPQRPNYQLLLTCEHGGNRIPRAYTTWFASADAQKHLNSHRGYDPGALDFAKQLAHSLDSDLHFSMVSRLLIELNRSLDSPQLFSKFSSQIDLPARERIVAEYYQPLRSATQQAVQALVASGHVVVHLSIHSFTPRYCGTQRNFDIGILFDPKRSLENTLSRQFLRSLRTSGFRAEANQPYLGTADGHTTELRKQFQESQYMGIEVELNNRITKLSAETRQKWLNRLTQAILSNVLADPTRARDTITKKAIRG